jgi:hypothetical protein
MAATKEPPHAFVCKYDTWGKVSCYDEFTTQRGFAVKGTLKISVASYLI